PRSVQAAAALPEPGPGRGPAARAGRREAARDEGPRDPRDPLRHRASGLRADRAQARRPRPRGRPPDLPREGKEGTPRAPRTRGAGLDDPLPERGAAPARPRRPRALALPEPAGGPPLEPGPRDDREAPRRNRRSRARADAARAPPFVREPPPRARGRSPVAASHARPRRHLDHPDLHPHHEGAPAQ